MCADKKCAVGLDEKQGTFVASPKLTLKLVAAAAVLWLDLADVHVPTAAEHAQHAAHMLAGYCCVDSDA